MRFNKRALRILFLFISSVILCAGCAFGNRKVDLYYPPKDDYQYKQYNFDTNLSKKMGIRKIAIVVADERPGDRKYLGEVRNGFYMHTADVVTDDSVEAWVQNAFTHELLKSGFSVVPKQEAQAVLEVSIDKVHCNAYWVYSAELQLKLHFTKGPRAEEISKVEGAGSAGMNGAATAAAYAESLAKALAEAYYKASLSFSKPMVIP